MNVSSPSSKNISLKSVLGETTIENLKGKFITFEGGEGVGKSTQAALLVDRLKAEKIKVKLTREPGGDDIGEKIRAILKSELATKMDSLCETLLLFAARRNHYIKVIKPLQQQGYVVVCDRFYDSTLVYQGILKKVPIEDIMYLKRMTVEDTEPDLTLILDVDSKISTERLAARHLLLDEIMDEYDTMRKEEHDTVRKGFQNIAKIFSFRTAIVNADGTERAVQTRVMREINRKFGIHQSSN